MDNAERLEAKELIRQAELTPKQLEQVREYLSSKYQLISRERIGWVGGAVVAFVATVGWLTWSAAAAGISSELSKNGVSDAVRKVEEYGDSAAAIVERAFPIGSIVAWHDNLLFDKKSITPEDVLGDAWLQCNGQTLTRAEHGDSYPRLFGTIPDDVTSIQLPDLNSMPGRFLRGGAMSGLLQDDAIKIHEHKGHNGVEFLAVTTPKDADSGHTDKGSYKIHRKVTTGGNIDGDRTETRPINMSVVWIIRVR